MDEQTCRELFYSLYADPSLRSEASATCPDPTNRWIKLAYEISSGSWAKPSPTPWRSFVFSSMNFNPAIGKKCCFKWVDEIHKVIGEQLSTLQEIVLSGDTEAAKLQAHQLTLQHAGNEEKGIAAKPLHLVDKSALHYAVTTGLVPMVDMLLDAGYQVDINKGDIVTGFTPMHLAVVTQNLPMALKLLQRGALVDIRDKFDATPLDYAKLLRFLPDRTDLDRPRTKIQVFDVPTKSLTHMDVKTFEEQFKVMWCPRWVVTPDYIEELMFSGMQLSSKDEGFRSKYLPSIEASSGDENIVIAKIDDTVGWGAFAARDIKKDEFIVRYGGCIERSKAVRDWSYSMQSGIEGVFLNSLKYRNLAAFINHSSTGVNAVAECIFHRGVELAVVIATEDIPKGKQLFLDYSDAYFKKQKNKTPFVDLSTAGPGEFPTYIPL